MNIRIHPDRLYRALRWALPLLVVLNLFNQSPSGQWLGKLFLLDAERNVPTLFATLLLLACAASYGLCALWERWLSHLELRAGPLSLQLGDENPIRKA